MLESRVEDAAGKAIDSLLDIEGVDGVVIIVAFNKDTIDMKTNLHDVMANALLKWWLEQDDSLEEIED